MTRNETKVISRQTQRKTESGVDGVSSSCAHGRYGMVNVKLTHSPAFFLFCFLYPFLFSLCFRGSEVRSNHEKKKKRWRWRVGGATRYTKGSHKSFSNPSRDLDF